MSSNGFDTPIRLKRTTSNLHFFVQLFFHCVALFAVVYPTSLPIIARILLVGLLLMSFAYQVHRLLRPLPVWVWYFPGEWRESQDDYRLVWSLTSIPYCTPWCILLKLRSASGERHQLLVLRDQIDRHTYRRLYVRLRLTQVDATIPGETI